MRKSRKLQPTTLSMFSLLLVLLLAPAAGAEQVTINPSADTTIYEEATTSSCGVGGDFISGSTNNGVDRRALLKFDIAAAVTAGSTINSVSLVLVIFEQLSSVLLSHVLLHIPSEHRVNVHRLAIHLKLVLASVHADLVHAVESVV